MTESQNIEYKPNWRDEYLKWICGFANANGGKLLIGVDDKGHVMGVDDQKRLMEEIPNKVVQHLGLAIETNLHLKENKHYIEIIVSPSSLPISYHGVFHYRSGSTKQELRGPALHDFLLRKMGKTWDGICPGNATINDIDTLSIHMFLRKALNSNRISSDVNPGDIEGILQNLNLLNENNQPRNAALLVFGKNPLRFFTTSYFKIGRFGKADHDLLFQDVVEGSILSMADKVIEILRSKYLVSPIRYKELQRIEELEYPEEALREAILNAIVHKDYTGAPIQMSVYNDKLILWNPGRLPEGITIEILKQKHPSLPANRNIAELFFKAGYIEVWGRGISKILNACKQAGLPEPIMEEYAGGIQITFMKNEEVGEKVGKEVGEKVGENLSYNQVKIMHCMRENKHIAIVDMAKIVGIAEKNIEKNIKELKKMGIVKRVGPAKGGYWEVTEKGK
jgi:ATP-dependent DNA helicase RecG